MSNKSFMDNLLKGANVEWKTLGEVGQLIRGNGLQKTDFTETGVPAIHYGQIYTYYGTFTTTTKSFVSPELATKLRKVDTGDVVITNTSENIEDVAKALVYLGETQAVTGGHATIFKPSKDILGKYFAYFTQTEIFASQKRKYAKGTKVIDVSATDMAKIKIPIPHIDVQEEIVLILDNFTELTAELTARKKQYNYYREKLLTNTTKSKVEKLEDIAKIYLGLTYTPTYVDSGIKFISAQNTSGNFLNLTNVKYISEEEYKKSTSNAKPKRGDVLFTRVGSNLGHPVIVDTDEELCIFVSLGFIRVNPNKVLNSYIKHWMNTDLFWDQVKKNVHGSAKVNLNTGWLNKFEVLLPDLEEQEFIVTILDKFESLTNSISEGLPYEIKLRQQQYDYYRDMLLSFPKYE